MVETPRASKLLIISHEIVGRTMTGPGIRYYHLARVLAQHVPTVLAVPGVVDPALPSPGFTMQPYQRRDWASLAKLVNAATICLLPGDLAAEFSELSAADLCIVIDGYNPLLPEGLALLDPAQPAAAQAWWRQRMLELAPQTLLGDFYLCASERQRDWWIGLLEAHGRINPATYLADPSLRNLLDLTPYGVDEALPEHSRPIIKQVWPGIRADDRLVLWGGGLWPWLDALTAIRAVAKVRETRPEVKLIFPGARHPNPAMAGMPTQLPAAQALAAELNLVDQGVFFGDWVPYADWENVMLESDVALSLHYDTLETRLAYRSRLFEAIRANLPSIVTTGDATSELVQHYQLGVVVDYGDVDGVAAALLQVLDEPAEARQVRFADARRQLSWERMTAPLIHYCLNPHRAADRTEGGLVTGNPYYAQRYAHQLEVALAALRDERDQWQRLAQGYANGRAMRMLLRVSRTLQKLRRPA
ncbi:MAG: glycosyltransferase family 4 protein [Chloroflexi bacterium]|nr:glycosyltransferase family 4 protein [Chloroflexota bacterium]